MGYYGVGLRWGIVKIEENMGFWGCVFFNISNSQLKLYFFYVNRSLK